MTVFELAPDLMERQLDEKIGKLLKTLSKRCGIVIHAGVTIVSVGREKTLM